MGTKQCVLLVCILRGAFEIRYFGLEIFEVFLLAITERSLGGTILGFAFL